MSFIDFLSSQEKAKYLFSFNFVALNFVLPQLEQVSCLHTCICSDYNVHFSFVLLHLITGTNILINQSIGQLINQSSH